MSDPFFDTNIVIDWLKRMPQATAELSRYRNHRINHFDTVELDSRIATAAADIRHRSKMKLMDAFILATAQVNGAILITRNTQDFPVNMPGIRVPYSL